MTALSAQEARQFLPYQVAWLNDTSRRKIWEKSRRIGATYCQSFEDVRDCMKKPGLPVWFSSADESAAKEYIMYCVKWAEIYKKGAEILSLGDEVLDEKNGVKALVIRFKNGSRIHGLSSNPTAFRSKGGKTILDEFDWHSDQQRMYAAAKPCVTWGYDLRILSTYQSGGGLYAQFIRDAKKARDEGKSPTFSLHTVDIFRAVEDGLLDKIMGRKTTPEDRASWIEEERAACGDENIWMQEYCCTPSAESEAFLTWDLIRPVEDESAGKPELSGNGDCFLGMDIGRRHDLTVFWVLEKVGDVLWTREVVRMKNASFGAQDEEQDRIIRDYNIRRCCMDQGGMGEKPVEDAKRRHGEYRVEGVIFNTAVKQELAFGVRRKFEDRQVRIPVDQDIRRSLHAIKKTTTTAGNVRFDADRTDKGHADEFWALALAVSAAGNGHVEYAYHSVSNRGNDPMDRPVQTTAGLGRGAGLW